MSKPGDDQPAGCELAHLPTEPVDPLSQAFVRFLGIEAAAGAILLLFTVAAGLGIAAQTGSSLGNRTRKASFPKMGRMADLEPHSGQFSAACLQLSNLNKNGFHAGAA